MWFLWKFCNMKVFKDSFVLKLIYLGQIFHFWKDFSCVPVKGCNPMTSQYAIPASKVLSWISSVKYRLCVVRMSHIFLYRLCVPLLKAKFRCHHDSNCFDGVEGEHADHRAPDFHLLHGLNTYSFFCHLNRFIFLAPR